MEDEGFANIEGAEDVGVESVVIFLCSGVGLDSFRFWGWGNGERKTYDVSSTAPVRMYPAAFTRCVT